MYKNKTVYVVVPAHNEATQIAAVIDTMPALVDRIVVVDDASPDHTADIVEGYTGEGGRTVLIRHAENQGVGGAIATGYRYAWEEGADVTVVMAGDGQMDPDDLENIIDPIATGAAHYTKGNRLFYGDAWNMIPHHRYLGNSFLSLLTKIASGYWHIADSQSGYTAISNLALKRISLDKIYKSYGMPNDILMKLNEYDFIVRDVHIRPVYNVGEKSGIHLPSVVPKLLWLLFKGFWRRMFHKYVLKNFHPLVFFYALSFLLLSCSFPLAIRLVYIWFTTGDIPDMNALLLSFNLISGLQLLLFGMWFDMDYNKHLK